MHDASNRGPLGGGEAAVRWKQRGTIKANTVAGRNRNWLSMAIAFGLWWENCDITIDELCVLLAAEGIEKRSTLGDFLLAQGLSRKKFDSPRRRAGAP